MTQPVDRSTFGVCKQHADVGAHALASDEREFWIAGRREEVQSLQDLKVFVLVPRSELPRGHRPLNGKLVCKRKRDATGKVVRNKVRYVAKGFAQRYGVDYDKTTAPTVRLESFRALLHISASLDWALQQFDIKTAFLHGVLPADETMFMEQPHSFEAPGKEDWVMHLMKSIYGMKQASRVWNQPFGRAVTETGFERLQCEWCVYRHTSPTGTIIFVVHVDDIIAAASSLEENANFSALLKSKWEITELGPCTMAMVHVTICHDKHFTAVTSDRKSRCHSGVPIPLRLYVRGHHFFHTCSPHTPLPLPSSVTCIHILFLRRQWYCFGHDIIDAL